MCFAKVCFAKVCFAKVCSVKECSDKTCSAKVCFAKVCFPTVFDTNNLIVDLDPGTGSALESFKLAHRGIDVLKAVEERGKMELENERRRSLIKAGQLGDPNIEQVVVVAGDEDQLGKIVVGTKTASTEIEED